MSYKKTVFNLLGDMGIYEVNENYISMPEIQKPVHVYVS